jgi:hypothetical protein
MTSELVKKIWEFLLVGVLFVGVVYAATTAWKNETKLTSIGGEIKSLKKTMLSLLLDTTPDKNSIAKELLSDISFFNGVKTFKSGEYQKAIQIWKNHGSDDSMRALTVAYEVLHKKLSLNEYNSEEEKTEIEIALSELRFLKVPGVLEDPNSPKLETTDLLN